MNQTPILLLAGGASSRMGGRDKLLENVNGKTLIRDRAETSIAANTGDVFVVLPPDRSLRKREMKGLDIQIIFNDGSDKGMANSLKCGLKAISTDQVIILLADLPDITADDINTLLNAAHNSDAWVVRGASAGKAGHPVLIRKPLFAELMGIQGDQGAQPVLQRYTSYTKLVSLPGNHATCDLDTPQDWKNWRNKRLH